MKKITHVLIHSAGSLIGKVTHDAIECEQRMWRVAVCFVVAKDFMGLFQNETFWLVVEEVSVEGARNMKQGTSVSCMKFLKVL